MNNNKTFFFNFRARVYNDNCEDIEYRLWSF